MQDRVYPSTKPTPPTPPPTNGTTVAPPPSFAAAANGVPVKPSPSYINGNIRRPTTYRPRPPPHRRCTCRRFCCLCFLYTLITLLSLLLLAAIAASIFYFLYHPKHPSFSVSSLRISTFNLTSPTSSSSSIYPHITSRINLTLAAKNPNTKLITFFYQPITVSASAAGSDLGNSSFPGFVSVPGNVTVLAASVASDPTKGQDPDSVNQLRLDLGKKGGSLPVELEFDAAVKVKVGKLKTKNVGIRVHCSGIRGLPPSAPAKNSTVPTPTLAGTAAAKCKVDLRLKIWKFTLF